MTDTQELDEILTRFADGEYSKHWVDERKTYTKLEAKQALLDWHNRQVEEVLDRIEKQATIITSLSGEKAGTVDLTAIEVERNKLKERDDDQL